MLEIFDKLYSEFWELPGKIVLSNDDIVNVVYRLIAIGFHNVRAFASFGVLCFPPLSSRPVKGLVSLFAPCHLTVLGVSHPS